MSPLRLVRTAHPILGFLSPFFSRRGGFFDFYLIIRQCSKLFFSTVNLFPLCKTRPLPPSCNPPDVSFALLWYSTKLTVFAITRSPDIPSSTRPCDTLLHLRHCAPCTFPLHPFSADIAQRVIYQDPFIFLGLGSSCQVPSSRPIYFLVDRTRLTHCCRHSRNAISLTFLKRNAFPKKRTAISCWNLFHPFPDIGASGSLRGCSSSPRLQFKIQKGFSPLPGVRLVPYPNLLLGTV